MTVSALADELEASPVTITAWENGSRVLKPERAKRVLAVLAGKGVYATLDTLYAAHQRAA